MKRLMAEYKRESGGAVILSSSPKPPAAWPGMARLGAMRCGVVRAYWAGSLEPGCREKAGLSLSPTRPGRLQRGRPWAQKLARPAPPWPCDPGLVPEPVCASPSRQLMLRGECPVIPVR